MVLAPATTLTPTAQRADAQDQHRQQPSRMEGARIEHLADYPGALARGRPLAGDALPSLPQPHRDSGPRDGSGERHHDPPGPVAGRLPGRVPIQACGDRRSQASSRQMRNTSQAIITHSMAEGRGAERPASEKCSGNQDCAAPREAVFHGPIGNASQGLFTHQH